MIHLKPSTVDAYNDAPSMAAGAFHNKVYRPSYSGIGDMMFNIFLKNKLFAPRPPKPRAPLTQAQLINAPDKLAMFNRILGRPAM